VSELGDFLRKLRGNLSLREAAKISGLSYSYISSLESGKHPRTGDAITPSPDTLKALSVAYKYDYEELMKMAGHLPDTDSFIEGTKSGEGIKEQASAFGKDSGMAFYGGGRDWTEEEIEIADALIQKLREQKEAKKKQK
jgi:transcriptional regulator with XRE-family HTH domain